jgi:hypothetical protein
MFMSAPFCPLCEEPAVLVLNDAQAFCGNEDCRCLMFDPSASDGGLSNPQIIDLNGDGQES